MYFSLKNRKAFLLFDFFCDIQGKKIRFTQVFSQELSQVHISILKDTRTMLEKFYAYKHFAKLG